MNRTELNHFLTGLKVWFCYVYDIFIVWSHKQINPFVRRAILISQSGYLQAVLNHVQNILLTNG